MHIEPPTPLPPFYIDVGIPFHSQVRQRLLAQRQKWEDKLAKEKAQLSASKEKLGSAVPKVVELFEKKSKEAAEARRQKEEEEERKKREEEERKREKLRNLVVPEGRPTKSQEMRTSLVRWCSSVSLGILHILYESCILEILSFYCLLIVVNHLKNRFVVHP